jgi:hypothetical protein
MRVITPLEITSDTAFSRASTATYYDANGIRQTADIDVVRVNYNPATLEPEGILIEDASTNQLTYSNDFSNAIWIKSRSAIDSNVTTAPDGTLTASRLRNNGIIDANGYINVNRTWDGGTYTFSVFAKMDVIPTIQLDFVNSVAGGGGFLPDGRTFFNLQTGTYITASTGSGFEVLTNGWYRVWITATPTAGTGGAVRIQLPGDATAGIDGYFIWEAQLESGQLSSQIPTTAVAVTRAADMLGDMVTSTVAEPDTGEALWNAATNYAIDDVVIRTTTHKKYINIQAGVNATLPEVDAALAEPTRWIETGSTNRFAMFDTLRNTQTEAISPLSVVIVPGERVNSIGILAMEAEEVTITVANGYEQIYTYTENLNTREVLSWYDYFFEPFSNTPNIVKFDLPPYTAGNVTITLTSSTGTVKCGAVIIGNYTDIGKLQYNPRISGTNFSRIDREFDGTATLIPRQTKPKVTGQLFFNKTQTNKILALKKTLNAVPTVWSGLDDDNTDGYFNGLLILGIYKLFDVDVAYPENALLDIEIEEI